MVGGGGPSPTDCQSFLSQPFQACRGLPPHRSEPQQPPSSCTIMGWEMQERGTENEMRGITFHPTTMPWCALCPPFCTTYSYILQSWLNLVNKRSFAAVHLQGLQTSPLLPVLEPLFQISGPGVPWEQEISSRGARP